MTQDGRSVARGGRLSVCLFCGSSDAASAVYLDAAAELGRTLAGEGFGWSTAAAVSG